MANEIWALATPGRGTLAAELRPRDKSQAWNGDAFAAIAALSDAQWKAGLLALTEIKTATGTSTGTYAGSLPADLPAAEYLVRVFDVADPNPDSLPIAEQVLAWSGTAEVTMELLAKSGEAVALKADQLPAIANTLLDLANGVETDFTLRDTLRLIAAGVAGLVSGAGSGVEHFTGLGGLVDRLTLTVDIAGTRPAITDPQ